MDQQSLQFELNRISPNPLLTIGQHQPIIFFAQTLPQKDWDYETRDIPRYTSAPPHSRSHSRLHGIPPALPEAYSPHFQRAESIPSPLHRSATQSIGPNLKFHQLTNPVGINSDHDVYVPEMIKYVSTPPHHTLKPTASSCSLAQFENEHAEE